MNILLFGISNVGKSTIGKVLAKETNFDFYDLDDEVKKEFNCTLEEFVNTGTLYERDTKRIQVLSKILSKTGNKIIAVTVLAHKELIDKIWLFDEVYTIELQDSVENIFDRLVFSDENDVIYKDDEYKNKHKDYYMYEIREDQIFYGKVWEDIGTKINVDNRAPIDVANEIIELLGLV